MTSTINKQGYGIENAGQDSFDFSMILKSDAVKLPRKSIIHHSIQGMFAIKSGIWKFVDGQGSGGWSKDESPTTNLKSQLYDLSQDPSETKNVVELYPEIAEKLKEELQKNKESGYTRPGGKDH